MRGKVIMPNQMRSSSGITPAYAGKRHASRDNSETLLGSPPPMRGKESASKLAGVRYGITPAYAGKSNHA